MNKWKHIRSGLNGISGMTCLLVCGVLFIMPVSPVCAQARQEGGSSLRRTQSFEQRNYNLKLGKVSFNISGGMRLEFNDNIGLNGGGGVGGFVPQIATVQSTPDVVIPNGRQVSPGTPDTVRRVPVFQTIPRRFVTTSLVTGEGTRLIGFREVVVPGTPPEFEDLVIPGQEGNDKPLTDFIIRPEINISAFWPITPFNALSLNAGFSYAKYLSNSEFDQFLPTFGINPDSGLEYDIYLGYFTLNLHDRFAITQNTSGEQGEITSPTFSQFQNTIGASLNWRAAKRLEFDLSYDKTTAFGMDNNNSGNGAQNQNSAADFDQFSILFNGTWIMNPYVSLGLTASQSSVQFGMSERGDAAPIRGGLFMNVAVTPHTSISLAGGIVRNSFEESSASFAEVGFGPSAVFVSTPEMIPASETYDPYWSLSISNRLNRYFTHSLSLSHDVNVGLTSQSTKTTSVSYGASWRMNSRLTLNGTLSYQKGQEAGGTTAEDFEILSAELSTTYKLGSKTSTNIGYRFTDRVSDGVVGQSFRQNIVFLDLRYDF